MWHELNCVWMRCGAACGQGLRTQRSMRMDFLLSAPSLYRSNTRQSEEPTQKARQNSQNLPRGLFMRQDGEVVDRLGNVYDRIPSGQFRVRQSARTSKYRNRQTTSQNLHQKEHSHKQEQNQPNQTLFRDMSGNVYIKDENGNLIKVQPQRPKNPIFAKPIFLRTMKTLLGHEIAMRMEDSKKLTRKDQETARLIVIGLISKLPYMKDEGRTIGQRTKNYT